MGDTPRRADPNPWLIPGLWQPLGTLPEYRPPPGPLGKRGKGQIRQQGSPTPPISPFFPILSPSSRPPRGLLPRPAPLPLRLLTAPSPPSACPGGRLQPSAGPGSAPRAHGQRQQPPPGPGGHGGRRRRRPPRAGGDPEPGGGGGGGRGGGGAAHLRQPPEGGKCPPRAPQRPQILSPSNPKGGRSPPWGLGVTPSCSSSLLFLREAPKYK